ncbi:MAG: acyl-CoA thioesterase [Candidatus Dormibacteraeota bacterium]|uniref:Acyl-CoA thioesterase n=1 Tax=Candidatus Amunia macphersoniae TaxID=3127014 RepID=A0A934NF79_9BACT|nr:acyl-CoA thioesterase [Candidatus Dormibacteraeota bacterium]
MSDPWARLRAQRDSQYSESVDMSARPAAGSQTQMCVAMEISHANNDGNVHGGTIMRLVDGAAGIAAMRHARSRVVTASMDDMSFLAPVYIGDLVTVRAMVNDAHSTSMEVGVRVDVENIATGEWRHVASAHLVFVALDADGRPSPVPPVLAETDDEARRQAQARVRREQRLLRKQALAAAARDGASR